MAVVLERAVEPFASQLQEVGIAVESVVLRRGALIRLTRPTAEGDVRREAHIWTDGSAWLELSFSTGVGTFVLDDFEELAENEFRDDVGVYVRIAASWLTDAEGPWDVVLASGERDEVVAMVDGVELRLVPTVVDDVRHWFSRMVGWLSGKGR